MLQPDSLDRRLLRELESPSSLRWNIRESNASIARTIGVDEETVRRRIERVKEAGILQGWELVLNPHLIGRESSSIEFEIDDQTKKGKIIEQIKLMDGILSILNFQGSTLQVGVFYKNENFLERQVSLIESLCGKKHSMLWNVVFPPCDLKMTKTDWEILSSLRKNPRGKMNEIADGAKISIRTLRRRLDVMEEGYAFFLHATIDLKKLGGLAYRLLVYCKNSKKKENIDESIFANVQEIEWSYTFSENYSMFVLYCENTLRADDISKFVSNLGVDGMKMNIIEEQITVQSWIEDEIELMISTPKPSPDG